MSGIDLGYSYELGSGRTRIRVMTRPRWGLGTVMTLSHPHLQWKLMANRSLRSPRSLTPKSTIDAKLANSCSWSGGPVMKALMKKPHGYLPLNLAMQLNSLTNTIPGTQINPAPWPLPNSGTIPSQNSHVRIQNPLVSHAPCYVFCFSTFVY